MMNVFKFFLVFFLIVGAGCAPKQPGITDTSSAVQVFSTQKISLEAAQGNRIFIQSASEKVKSPIMEKILAEKFLSKGFVIVTADTAANFIIAYEPSGMAQMKNNYRYEGLAAGAGVGFVAADSVTGGVPGAIIGALGGSHLKTSNYGGGLNVSIYEQGYDPQLKHSTTLSAVTVESGLDADVASQMIYEHLAQFVVDLFPESLNGDV